MNRSDATQLLSRWLPGVSGQPVCSGGSSRSAASSDVEARCSCFQPGCSLCQGSMPAAAGPAGKPSAVDSRSTGSHAVPGGSSSSGSVSPMGSASDGTGGGRSNATSERRWLPCWAATREASS